MASAVSSGEPEGPPGVGTAAYAPSSSVPTEEEFGLAGVVALLASLVGILGIAYSIYSFKFLGATEIAFLPPRIFFVLSLGLATAPFLLVILYSRVPYLFVVIPLALLFLLYPLLSPHGVVYGKDALFNFQFASTFLNQLTWTAGGNTTGQAVTYSYFPASGLFNAEGSVFTGVALTSSFPWMLPLTRLLIIPPVLFAIGSRLLGPRAGLLGVYFYLATPSITFNDLVQQEFAVQFFILAVAAITFLAYAPREQSTPLRILVLVFSTFVILSHHLTSYVMGLWLGALAVIPLLLWGRPEFVKLRSGAVAVRYLAFFFLYVYFLSADVVLSQLTLLERNILHLLSNAPLSAKATAAGSSYPTYQLLWIIGGLALTVLLALLTLRRTLLGKHRPYLATLLVAAALILVVSFVLFATPYSFVAIRTTEYALVVAAPAAAWYLIHRFVARVDAIVRPPAPDHPRSFRGHEGRWVAPIVAVLVAVLIFTGGNLVPGASRDQFQPPSVLAVNSPMHVTAAAFQDGIWARTYLDPNEKVWGDMLVYDVYSAIGGLRLPYDSYQVFSGSGFTLNNTARLRVGDYVVTDVYDTQLRPEFLGSGTEQPSGPLAAAQVGKFYDPSHFSVVFADSLFTVFQVTSPFYFVTFSETGLPAGTAWSVTVDGIPQSSTNSSLSFLEPNGTHDFTVGVAGGLLPHPPSGTVTVTGSSPTVRIVFA